MPASARLHVRAKCLLYISRRSTRCSARAQIPTGAADASWLIEELHQASARAEPSEWLLSVEALICKANTILIDTV